VYAGSQSPKCHYIIGGKLQISKPGIGGKVSRFIVYGPLLL
jgi:hypothetical protein